MLVRSIYLSIDEHELDFAKSKKYCITIHCTAGDEGPVADISCMNIFSHFQGLLTSVQLAATK